MELKLVRELFSMESTFGSLYINGEYFCKTLEDRVRDLEREKKVYGKTAVPFGRYGVELYQSPRFKRKLPRLLDVPCFEGVLIHRGNWASDTDGCILVGRRIVGDMLCDSTPCEKYIVELLQECEEAGERSYIEICCE